jgi:hypothetical protein
MRATSAMRPSRRVSDFESVRKSTKYQNRPDGPELGVAKE